MRGAGHDSRELESDEYLDLLARFLAGDELEDQTIDLPALEFPPLR